MLQSYKIGKTRIELAKILTEYLGFCIAPANIETNFQDSKSLTRWLGWACSWSVDVGDGSIISPYTMVEFVKQYRSGKEIFELQNGNQRELLFK